LRRKRAPRKDSATPALTPGVTPAATPAPIVPLDRCDPLTENVLDYLMRKIGLDDPRKCIDLFLEHASEVVGMPLSVEWTTKNTEQKLATDFAKTTQLAPPWMNMDSPEEAATNLPPYSPHEPWPMEVEPRSSINAAMTVDSPTPQPTDFDFSSLAEFHNETLTTIHEHLPTIREPSSQSMEAYPNSMDDADLFDSSLLYAERPMFPWSTSDPVPFVPAHASPRRGLPLKTTPIIGPSYPGIIRVPCN
jgi:hypothetical protein